MGRKNEYKYIISSGDTFGDLVFIKETRIPCKTHSPIRGALFRCKCGNLVEYKLVPFLKRKTTKCLKCYNKSETFLKTRHRNKPGEPAKNEMYRSYKNQAIKRGFTFNLSKEDFLLISERHCFYCGREPYQQKGNYYKRLIKTKGINHIYLANGIDRVNSSEGYYDKNCVACCEDCNRAKSNKDINKFLDDIDILFRVKKENENS